MLEEMSNRLADSKSEHMSTRMPERMTECQIECQKIGHIAWWGSLEERNR